MPEDSVETSDFVPAWIKALGASDLGPLRQRLLWDGVPLEKANAYLMSLLGREAPHRFAAIKDWLRDSTPIDELEPPEALPFPFSDLWERAARGAIKELASCLSKKAAAYYQADKPQWGSYKGIHRDLIYDFVRNLATVAEPTLWAEFNLRRTPNDIILAHLRANETAAGSPGRTIYRCFLEELRADGLHSLARKYPVLRRHLSGAADRWFQYSREILTRVYNDRQLLHETFAVPVDAMLTSITQNLSDPHRGGRTVALLTFASDSPSAHPHRVVYKPKDLRIDHAFQRLLSVVPSPTSADSPPRRLVVLPRDGYGYMEWAPHRISTSDTELCTFYRNAGRLTAILHLLGCTDCHHENLIACGGHLVLIDAETLFEGVHPARPYDPNSPKTQTGLQRQITNSVVRIGILPQWSFVGNQRLRRDVSALGVLPPQSSSQQVVGWIALNTDGMIADDVDRPVTVPASLPVGIGSPNRLGDFAEAFCDGFECQLNAISENKRQWLDEIGILSNFAGCKRRVLPRPTWFYRWLIGELVKPSSLKSEADQRLTLEQLGRSYLVPKLRPKHWPLFSSEIGQIENLDVPFFEQQVDDRSLILPDGSRLDDILELSGLENARNKVQELTKASIEFQVGIVRGMISAKHAHTNHVSLSALPTTGSLELNDLSDEDRFSEAKAIGELLVRTAISCDDEAVEWLAIDVTEDAEKSKYGPLGLSLYGGRSGIALFLAAMAQDNRADAAIFRRTALAACSDLFQVLKSKDPGKGHRWWRDQPLGLAGSGGIILALIHIAEMLPDMKDEILSGVSSLMNSLDVELVKSDDRLDIVLGCAGLIGPLAKIGSSWALSLAQEAGNQLVSRQHVSGGWAIANIGATPLTGFSHGASGIAAALVKLYSLNGQFKYLDAAAKALQYERQVFDSTARNWPDFRGHYDPEKPRFMLSWCHGAPGIALARLCSHNTPLEDRDTKEELHDALTSTANLELAGDSVCCGRFGRAAVLRLATRDNNEREWGDAAVQIEKQALGAKRSKGVYSFLDTPGLFTGYAGVGLSILDSISSDKSWLLPSILSAGLYERS